MGVQEKKKVVDEKQDTLEISVAAENFNEIEQTNLKNLISSKSSLLKKVIGTESLEYSVKEDKITFPWFVLSNDYEVLQAYQQLLIALINKAKIAKRISPIEKETDNEKFTFRIFLISLGMSGEEFKKARKILLKNLSGNSAYKNGGKNHVSK